MFKRSDINTVERCQKRYMTISLTGGDSLKIDYPEHFINSGRQKYVHVVNTHLFVEDSTDNSFSRPVLCSLHASFVQDADDLDHFVCMINSPLYKRKKYEQFNNSRSFTIWLKDYKGTPMTLTSDTTLIIELMLEY